MFKTKKELVLSSLLILLNAVNRRVIGGKLIQIGPFVMSILPWPIVF
jgi:hypothetical protein